MQKGDGERGSVAKGLACSNEDQCSDPRPYVTSWANACNSIQGDPAPSGLPLVHLHIHVHI